MKQETKGNLVDFAVGLGSVAAITGAAAATAGFTVAATAGAAIAGAIFVSGAVAVATAAVTGNVNVGDEAFKLKPFFAGAATSLVMIFGSATYDLASQVDDLTQNHTSTPVVETLSATLESGAVNRHDLTTVAEKNLTTFARAAEVEQQNSLDDLQELCMQSPEQFKAAAIDCSEKIAPMLNNKL